MVWFIMAGLMLTDIMKDTELSLKKGFKNQSDNVLPVSVYIGDKLIEKYPIKKIDSQKIIINFS
ncbi:hypothetical protein [Morganella morganii]|uniref:hypothetical protein n=1 Tax=Morganella morganii TaxID=582 RepID=UPI0030FEF9E0